MADIYYTLEASRKLDDLTMHIEALSPLDGDYIKSEIERITTLLKDDPTNPSLRRMRVASSSHPERTVFIEVIRTSSYVDHDVAIIWTESRGRVVVITYELQYAL